MEFEYTSSIWLTEYELNELAEEVRAGVEFSDAFEGTMQHHDSEAYYNSELIADAVEKEVMRRVNEQE